MVPAPGPVRTCVGCRARAPKADLLRVVAGEGEVLPDPRGRLPGRGASLHPDPRCLDLAERRRAFPRALRLPGPLDTAALRALVEARARAASTTGTTSTTAAPPRSTAVPSPPTGSRSRTR